MNITHILSEFHRLDEANLNDKVSDILNATTENNVASSDSNEPISIKDLIKPQVEIARSVIAAVNNIFENDCNNSYIYKTIAEQISNLEKTIRGSCEQLVSILKTKNFDTTNSNICSPKAYSIIENSDSRDRSLLDLAAAIIIFNNSIK